MRQVRRPEHLRSRCESTSAAHPTHPRSSRCVSGTPHTAVILAHTATEPDASVARRPHEDDLVTAWTRRVEVLPLTVLAWLCTNTNTTPTYTALGIS